MSHTHYGDSMMRLAKHCHVCSAKFKDTDVVVEHSGAGMLVISGQEHNAGGSIALHPECATILAMRLLSDVMDIRTGPEMRVVDALRNIRDAYQMQ
jgi:hypothetical protein